MKQLHMDVRLYRSTPRSRGARWCVSTSVGTQELARLRLERVPEPEGLTAGVQGCLRFSFRFFGVAARVPAKTCAVAGHVHQRHTGWANADIVHTQLSCAARVFPASCQDRSSLQPQRQEPIRHNVDEGVCDTAEVEENVGRKPPPLHLFATVYQHKHT
eukprot:CAMPEP_0194527526 /NCGR_PEP_ID=MMETSP0253-20130528/63663_1 /TAXON_ID=2966 /ORGANISM="Noctiluca scintillans" /LENGTH=158 /DNA_ID=CAMNT_0039372479 /DNA_START=229 /DNA_END=705 /DNA_ORIENTATION=-